MFLIPTVVDTEQGHFKQRDPMEGNRIVVGWTGTHTTLHNLEVIEGVIPELKKEIDFDFLLISNKPPQWNFDFIYKKWGWRGYNLQQIENMPEAVRQTETLLKNNNRGTLQEKIFGIAKRYSSFDIARNIFPLIYEN